MVDHALFDPAELYQGLRVSMYRALLGHQLEEGKGQQVKKQMQNNKGTLSVSELMQSQRSYRKRNNVVLKLADSDRPRTFALPPSIQAARVWD